MVRVRRRRVQRALYADPGQSTHEYRVSIYNLTDDKQAHFLVDGNDMSNNGSGHGPYTDFAPRTVWGFPIWMEFPAEVDFPESDIPGISADHQNWTSMKVRDFNKANPAWETIPPWSNSYWVLGDTGCWGHQKEKGQGANDV
jgi:hypothetical protein